MKSRRIKYLAACMLLLIVGVWVARNTYWDETRIPIMPTGEAATNHYYSVQRLLPALGIKTSFMLSLSTAPSAQGFLLIDGLQNGMSHNAVNALFPWVESGGHLIITDDVVRANPRFQEWSDIHRGARFDIADKVRPAATANDADDNCSALDVAVEGVRTSRKLTLCIPANEFRLDTKRPVAWSISNQSGMQLLRVTIGRGSVTVIPQFNLIANQPLLRHDHAEIFIAASGLAAGSTLYILSVVHAEMLLAMVWRIAAPALVFFGLAILCIILRELPRFGPPLPTPAMVRRSLAEQIRANASFAWRTRKLTALRTAVRRALDETASKRIASYSNLNIHQRSDVIGAWVDIDPKTLHAAMAEDAATDRHVQRTSIALLEQTRRLLNTRNTRKDRQII